VSAAETNDCPICGEEFPASLRDCPFCAVDKSRRKFKKEYLDDDF
jgi:hypothetical protein